MFFFPQSHIDMHRVIAMFHLNNNDKLVENIYKSI